MTVPNVFDAQTTPIGNQAVQVQNAAQNAIIGYAIRQLDQQPWWKKSSNTVTTLASGLAVLAWWLTSTGIGLPEWLTYIVGAGAVVGQGIVAKTTKNGFTNKGAADLQYAVQDETVLAAIWDQVVAQGYPMHSGEK
ncbi:holin [Gordonia phage Soos]|nr:holin [Gordonia phage Soos]